jgi:hypothetical protein
LNENNQLGGRFEMKNQRKKGITERIIAVIITLVMIISVIPPVNVKAASPIGSLNGKEYISFSSLVDDLEDDYENKSVTIEMLTNWNTLSNSDYDQRLIIPSGCYAVLEMHGYHFNRNKSYNNDYESNGELICVEEKATLTINGYKTEAEKNRVHSESRHRNGGQSD